MKDNYSWLDEVLFKIRTFREVEHNDNQWSTEFVYSLDEAKQALQSYIDTKIIEARKETVLHFRKIAQHEKDRGYGCDRILGETNIMAKNKWKAPNHRKETTK